MSTYDRNLERRLRDDRPRPGDELVRAIAGAVREERGRRTRPALRPAVACALTVGMLVALGSAGGAGYAADAVVAAVDVVKRAVSPSGSIELRGVSSGRDQYRAGYAWGDPDHNHEGAPGLRRAGGVFAPPVRARLVDRGRAAVVSTSFTIDEQAHLVFSVLDRRGRKLLLTQSSRRGGSRIGDGVSGPQTKNIQYQVLVPRSIPVRLRIPANLLRRGILYRISIVAVDPDGNRQAITIPFRLL